MKWLLLKSIFTLMAIFMTSQLIISTAIVFAVAAAAYAIDTSATTTTYLLKITRHPSTYFDSTKPRFNEFTHFGIRIKMPVGEVIKHAKMAFKFIQKMPY